MKKLLLRVILLAAALCLLTTAALAAEGDFNAGLTIETTDTSITVTVQDSTVLETNTPTLTIPTGMEDWTYAKVTFEGTELEDVAWDDESKSVTFPVAAGGAYVIEQAEAPAPDDGGEDDKEEDDDDKPVHGPALKPTDSPAPEPMDFSDIKKTDWFFRDVQFVYEAGLMNGVGGGRFEPNGTVNRAMIVTILWRMEGEPTGADADFLDVASGIWYEAAVNWAGTEGIVDGYGNGLFGPTDAITREQLATILWRYAKYKGYDVSVGENTNILSYNDIFDASEYAIPALQWACGAGLIQGDSGNLMPRGNATRAQAAAILTRFCN